MLASLFSLRIERWGECWGGTGWLRDEIGVEVFLEAGEELVDLGWVAAEVGDGVGDGVVILEAEEGREFGLVEFGNAFGDVVVEDEIEEGFLFGVEGRVDVNASVVGALGAGDGRQGVGHRELKNPERPVDRSRRVWLACSRTNR